MQIKKDVKEKIILQLVARAAKKHGPSMGKAAAKLDDLFRAVIVRHVSETLPEVEASRWPALIQSGMLTRFSGMNPSVQMQMPGRKPGEYSGYAVGYVGEGVGQDVCDLYWCLKSLMGDEGWAKFLGYVDIEKRYGNFTLKWKMSYSDLPGLSLCSSMDIREGKQTAWATDAWPLHEQAQDLNNKFLRVLKEAKDFYDELQIIFAGIRTAKQLEDQFPEAAKLLPAPPPKRQEVAPKDLIDKAKRILETGIPN